MPKCITAQARRGELGQAYAWQRALAGVTGGVCPGLESMNSIKLNVERRNAPISIYGVGLESSYTFIEGACDYSSAEPTVRFST